MLSGSHARVLADRLIDNGVCVAIEPLFGDSRRVIFPVEFHSLVVTLLDELNTPVAAENVGKKKSGTPEGLEGHVCGQAKMSSVKAQEGWWCKRPAGHAGPCAAEPPKVHRPVRPEMAVFHRLEAVRWEDLQKDDRVWALIYADGMRTLCECKVADPARRGLVGRSIGGTDERFSQPFTDEVYRDPQTVKAKAPARTERRVVVLVARTLVDGQGSVRHQVDNAPMLRPVVTLATDEALRNRRHLAPAAEAFRKHLRDSGQGATTALIFVPLDEDQVSAAMLRQLNWEGALQVEVD